MAKELHVALLRGVNVGGKNRLAMQDLAAFFTAAGCREVSTYIQSGNVVFLPPGPLPALQQRIERDLEAHFGRKIALVMRSRRALAEIVAKNPFLADAADPTRLHVAFLARQPSAAQSASLDPKRSPPDAFVVRGSEIYLHLPHGVAETKLSNDYLDRTLATTTTVRNWRTVLALHARTSPH